MKNKLFLLGMLVMVLAFGMTVAGCDDGENDTPPPITSATGIEMVWIPAGSFMMGSPASEPNRGSDETQHSVTLTSGYYMGKYQVTQKQWEAVMGNDDRLTAVNSGTNYGRGDNFPMYYVSWYDAIVFCNRLSLAEGLTPAYQVTGISNWNSVTAPTGWSELFNPTTIVPGSNGYRLPTEAQWEYAARGAYPNKATETNTKPFGIGDGTKITSSMANFNGRYPYDLARNGEYNDPTGAYLFRTTPVGNYPANNYRLYDMHGNVREWCWDWYGSYTSGAQTDPAGPSGSYRLLRGGYWSGDGRELRSAYRGYASPPGSSDMLIGFRLVRP